MLRRRRTTTRHNDRLKNGDEWRCCRDVTSQRPQLWQRELSQLYRCYVTVNDHSKTLTVDSLRSVRRFFCYRALDRLYSSDVTVTSRCRTDDAISRVGTSVVQLLTDYTMSVTVGSRSPTWPPRPRTTSPRWLSSGDLRGFRDVIRHTLQLIAYRIS